MSRHRPGIEKLFLLTLSVMYMYGAWRASEAEFGIALATVPLMLLASALCALIFAGKCMDD